MSLNLHSCKNLRTSNASLLGVPFGTPDQLLSPAYWKQRCAQNEKVGHDYISTDSSLAEEVGFCLLGGYGVREELASAYYQLLKSQNVFLLPFCSSEGEIYELLRTPVKLNGKEHRYRFPGQKSERISRAMRELSEMQLPTDSGKEFRDALTKIHGIGPKTASWIARNWFGAQDVAILDIHLLRACRYMGLFDDNLRLPRDYEAMELQFLAFARNIDVRPAILDAVIWDDMRLFGSRLAAKVQTG